MDFIPEVLKTVELADGNNQGVGIGAIVGQVIQKLLGDLLNLLIAAPEVHLQHRLIAVERGRQNHVLKSGIDHAPVLLAFGQQPVLMLLEERRQAVVEIRFKGRERHWGRGMTLKLAVVNSGLTNSARIGFANPARSTDNRPTYRPNQSGPVRVYIERVG